MESLDEFDRKILNILQQDNMTSQRVIAERVALSAAAVHRRIERLHSLGIVARNVAVVDPEKIGRLITLIVDVTVESERAEELAALKRVFASAPEVQQCYYVTGEQDFILVVTTRDMKEYEALTHRLFFGHPNVKRFRTQVVMDRVKATLDVPL